MDALIKRTAKLTQMSERTLYRWKTEMEDASEVLPPKKRSCGKGRDRTKKLDDFDQSVLRRVVHGFFGKGEIPTIPKVLQCFEDETLPTVVVAEADEAEDESVWTAPGPLWANMAIGVVARGVM
ncbi:hypothetical protein HPB50_025447 [Hyalomma asiaticum]|uniref:Uncharacterized protein n=1 Tax=Hyalomma asiaticum TaxID=266040 RepID=A0ACB7RMX5_HYAAI|nr:hypothetical protein HPB50_025447 [Hyalomma asiaticum]